ncbi:hypothetical protein PV371_37555 [Streptomyces sp. TX20-6-3]|uniref:hypothetical protein n=1 Tax=Streptomyces sp. TX20-6-3 TaxID=3028705 RepID=UPI0029B65423|nr:hypothetical protein [Streptomyces sp. TX20-6-3]MDX2565293.1 hypothetical protein [Streptomyces sp. TX20-6-3]
MTLNPWRKHEPLDHAELARLLPAPGTSALPSDLHLLLEEHLMNEIQHQHSTPAASAPPRRSRRRLVYLALPTTLVALAGGAVAATTLMGSSPASEANSVRCYSAATLNAPYNGMVTTETTPATTRENISATVTAALNSCAGLWEASLIQPGKLGTPTVEPGGPLTIPSAAPGQGKVPHLTACVLDSGQAAVFPGKDRNLCQNLGLAQLTDQT